MTDNPSSVQSAAPVLGGEQTSSVVQANAPQAAINWLDSMPEDLRSSASLQKFKDTEALARGYINAEQFIGREKIPMPKSDAEFAEVYRRLGAPDSVQGYTLNSKDFEQYGQGALTDLEAFKGMALEANLSDAQATKIFNAYVKQMTQYQQAADTEFEMAKFNARTELQKMWGKEYDVNMQKANRALSYLASPELITALTDTGIANNVEFISMMKEISKHYVEEQGIDKSAGNQFSVNQVNEEIEKLMVHPAYFDKTHPEHQLIVRKVTELFAKKAEGQV